MTVPLDMPAPWRAWSQTRRSTCPNPAVLRGLNARLAQVYSYVGPADADAMTAVERARLRRLYLRTPGDLRRVRRYVVENVGGVRSTLRAASWNPDSAGLLGPEVLLVLERLDGDPFGVRAAWPEDASMEALLALADANARPFAD